MLNLWMKKRYLENAWQQSKDGTWKKKHRTVVDDVQEVPINLSFLFLLVLIGLLIVIKIGGIS